MPLDKDIIREAWVAGDLKDQLGIKHRKRKRRTSDHEHSALYNGSHMQSVSEDGYQPAHFSPPPSHARSPPEQSPPPLIVTTPAAEEEFNAKTPRAQHFSPPPLSPGSYRSDSHSASSSSFLQTQRSPVMRSVDQTQLTVGGSEYELGQMPRPGGYADASIHSRASGATFMTANSEPPWDDDNSPRAV